MKTITLTLTEEQAQQLLQQLLDPNNGNSYRIEAAKEEEPATSPIYTHKAMDPDGKWWKYTSKPYSHDGPNKPQWVSGTGELSVCSPSEIPADFTGDWKDSLMPM